MQREVASVSRFVAFEEATVRSQRPCQLWRESRRVNRPGHEGVKQHSHERTGLRPGACACRVFALAQHTPKRKAWFCTGSHVSPASSPRTVWTYSRSSVRRMGPSPIVRRAVKPVATPKTILPGASAFRDARPLAAATGAMRLLGTSTPEPMRIRVVRAAASAAATRKSVQSSCVSYSQAYENPSSSARRT